MTKLRGNPRIKLNEGYKTELITIDDLPKPGSKEHLRHGIDKYLMKGNLDRARSMCDTYVQVGGNKVMYSILDFFKTFNKLAVLMDEVEHTGDITCVFDEGLDKEYVERVIQYFQEFQKTMHDLDHLIKCIKEAAHNQHNG